MRDEDTQLLAAINAVLRRRHEHPTPTPRHPEPLVYPALPKR
jgi:hypothetical protein